MKLKHILLVPALLSVFGLAHAQPGNNGGGNGGCGVGQQTNGCGGQGGTGIGIGIGGAGGHGGSVVGSGNSSNALSNKVDNRIAVENRTTNEQGQLQGQQQAAIATQGQSSVNDNRSGANNSGNNASTVVSVGGDTFERQAPPVYAGQIPAVPTSCRLYLFGGGTNVNGAVSGSIPLGNDQTCLSIAALNLMERAGGFSQSEKQAIVCKVEGMSELGTCKSTKSAPVAVSKPKAAAMAVTQTQPAQVASAQPAAAPTVERYVITAAGLQRVN